jgi:hypothetical protein
MILDIRGKGYPLGISAPLKSKSNKFRVMGPAIPIFIFFLVNYSDLTLSI